MSQRGSLKGNEKYIEQKSNIFQLKIHRTVLKWKWKQKPTAIKIGESENT